MPPKAHSEAEDGAEPQREEQQEQPPCLHLAGTPEEQLAATAERMPSWIEETIRAAQRDTRRQPWRATFGESVDCRFDDGEDLVRIERSVGGRFDPDCPFRTQGSSLAA